MSDLVKLTIDGRECQVPKGTNVLEAARTLGIEISYFCYHPGLSSPAVCRQCLVDVKGQPKLAPSCYTPVAEGMVVVVRGPLERAHELALDQGLPVQHLAHVLEGTVRDGSGAPGRDHDPDALAPAERHAYACARQRRGARPRPAIVEAFGHGNGHGDAEALPILGHAILM